MPKPSAQELNTFLVACYNGKADMVGDMLQKNPDLAKAANEGGTTGLMMAALNGHDAVVFHLGVMGRILAFGQDASMDAGMESLHPSPQNLGGTGVLRHLGDGNASGRQRGGGAPTSGTIRTHPRSRADGSSRSCRLGAFRLLRRLRPTA